MNICMNVYLYIYLYIYIYILYVRTQARFYIIHTCMYTNVCIIACYNRIHVLRKGSSSLT